MLVETFFSFLDNLSVLLKSKTKGSGSLSNRTLRALLSSKRARFLVHLNLFVLTTATVLESAKSHTNIFINVFWLHSLTIFFFLLLFYHFVPLSLQYHSRKTSVSFLYYSSIISISFPYHSSFIPL